MDFVRKFAALDFIVRVLVVSMLFPALALAGTKFQATTTLAAETGNNTSTADTFVALSNGDIGASNISKMPTRSLLYPGSTSKIYAHFMPWFGFGDHMNVGYASNDALQVQKQVNDMVSRGLDGTIIDWYGPGERTKEFAAYDQAAQFIMQQAALHPGFQFAIMYDAGALKACAATVGCDVTQTMINDLNYVNTTYEGSPAYITFNGRPVIFFFGDPAYTIDWTRVRTSVAGNPEFIFRNSGAFTHTQSNGGFSWVAPHTAPSTDIASLGYLDGYYQTALSHSTMFSTGSGYKGFNDSLAAWGSGRFIDQQCGQTWLQSLAEAGKYYSATKQEIGVQLVTWNDYEEATEIETGIDNCVTVSAAVTGTVVNWTITGQQNTIDHFSVYASQDGQNLMWLADASAATRTMDLAQFALNAGNYIVFVKATGKPSLTNKMSAGVQLTVPNKPPVTALSVTPLTGNAPVTVTASAAASTDSDGNIASTSINFGDGSAAVSAVSASHIYSVGGTYTVTATVTDNLGATSSASALVTVVSGNRPPVALLSVTPNSGIAPVTVTASTAGSSDPDGTIAKSSINFGDGSLAVSATSASHVYSAAGTYTVTATVTDNSGASSSASSTVTVALNKPPVASLAVTPGSGYGPLTVSASTAGSSDPDGTVGKSTISFGDGSAVVSGPSAAHTYATAGVYTVVAIVTDNLGATSSTSSTVTVKAPAIIVTSPQASGTTAVSVSSPVHVVASGFSGNTVTTMQIYVDGVLTSSVKAASVDTLVKMALGAHALAVKGWDSSGLSFMTSLNLAVVNQPPTVVLSTSAASILVGGSITASTSGSSDPDGTIASSSINFGDGSPAVAGASASHQYKIAGTYTITATVKDNSGASSSTSRSVAVNPQSVAISSPVSGSTTTASSVQVVGTASSGYTVTSSQIYVDGVLKYQTAASSVNTPIALSVGTHRVTVQSRDASGVSFKSSVSVTKK